MEAFTQASRQAGAAWDEQIVPALRKRLEHESAYLSNRLSATDFPELSSDPHSAPLDVQPQSSLQHAFPPSGPSSSHHDSDSEGARARVRSRTTSNPHLLDDRPTPSRTPSNPLPPSTVLLPRRSISPLPNVNRSALESKLPEAYVKDELPPFTLYPDEALHIAEHGHGYDAEGGIAMEFGSGVSRFGDENWQGMEEGEKRRRSITMKPGTSSPGSLKKTVRGGGGRAAVGGRGVDGMPRSTTASVGIGMGQPSTRLGPGKGRAASTNTRTALSSSGSSAPRSASMNMLASPSSAPSSRLGPAAHWIPPESTYTPPKGTDWDDVVIPSVAKKLGMSGSKSPPPPAGEEGDLAVEWDKDGIPIKWVKRPPPTSPRAAHQPPPIDFGAPRGGEDDWNDHTRISSTKSAFSPTFEPSPENPLHQSTSSWASQGTPTPTPQKPLLRPQRSAGYEQSPLRPLPDNSWGQEPPPSPAPFSSLTPNPHHSPTKGNSPSVSRKNSFLGRPSPSPAASRQASQRSMRAAYSAMQGSAAEHPLPRRGASFNNPVAAQSRAEAQAAPSEHERRAGSPSSSFGMGPSGEGVPRTNGQAHPANRRGKTEDDTHGKGCACIIM